MPEFQTSDGVSIYFEETGAGTPIVFVHEFGGDYRSWHLQVRELRHSFRCITFSARGFRPSSVPENRGEYGQLQSTSDLRALLDHLELDDANIVGTSMGSFTSIDFALQNPDRITSLTLVGNSSGPRNEQERNRYRQDWVCQEARLREERGGEGAVAVLEEDPAYQSFQKNDPKNWARYAMNLQSQSAEGAVHVLLTVHWNRRSLFEDRARLQAFNKPVLLVTGDEDYYLVGDTNAFLKDTLPNAVWHKFPATGHLVNIERATEFNRLLAEHAARV